MKKYILHILNYAASYKGNFIDSLEQLNEVISKDDAENIYLITGAAINSDAMTWINELKGKGRKTFFLDGKRSEDTKIIRELVKKYNVVAIHSHFITMNQYLAIAFANYNTKLPIVMHMHNHSTQANNIVKNILRQFIYRKCYMVACSESVLRSLQRDYPHIAKKAIDNGVNFNRLDDYVKITKQDFDINPDEHSLLIFGFDFYRKGVDLAVKAIDKLRKEGEKYTLLISLSRNFDEVERNINEIIGELPDWVKIIKARNDVASLYNAVDAFLSPSREEGLPYSVVEASYSTCSVVMSDISAQKFLKVPYGVWFESENVEALSEAIKEANIAHSIKLDDYETVKKSMRENYDLENWAINVRNTYRELKIL